MKAHISEDYINLDSLDEPQLMAQYFRNFDLDKNGKLDGLEMLKAIHRMNGDSLNLIFHVLSVFGNLRTLYKCVIKLLFHSTSIEKGDLVRYKYLQIRSFPGRVSYNVFLMIKPSGELVIISWPHSEIDQSTTTNV